MSTLSTLTTKELIDCFTRLDHWEARFDYLLHLARQLPPFDEAELTDNNRIQGCVSQVWLKCIVTEEQPARLRCVAQSDSELVNGLLAVLMVVYDGKTLHHVLATDVDDVLRQMELETNLSPTRRNGLYAVVQHIRSQAKQALDHLDRPGFAASSAAARRHATPNS